MPAVFCVHMRSIDHKTVLKTAIWENAVKFNKRGLSRPGAP